MGKALKRVPLDFNWPTKKIWEGFQNPFWKLSWKCPDCKLGYSKEGSFLHDSFYSMYQDALWGTWVGRNLLAVPSSEELARRGFSDRLCQNIALARKFGFKMLVSWEDKLDESDIEALIKADRLWDFTHTWDPEQRWQAKVPAYVPTPDEVNTWSGKGMGHDAINHGTLIRHRCAKAGIDHLCKSCKGRSRLWPDAETEKKYEDWEPQEPPSGDGFQLWETTTEGSPVSPVFKSLDELATWAGEYATTFGYFKAPKEAWKKMLEDDFVHHREGSAIFA